MQPDALHPAITAAFDAEIPDADQRRRLLETTRLAYAAPDRHYHNLRHLAHLAAALETVRSAVSDWNLLMLAAAYHDLVYDTARPDNEAASAARAAADLGPFLEPARLQRLQGIILATRHHGPTGDADTNLFTDADLVILGAAPADYAAYAAQIRMEYARFPDGLYNPGRTAVLRDMLAMPMLFKTPAFRTAYEAAARQNIEAEIARLTAR